VTTISFMTANYVARQLGYHMTDGWMQGDGSTQDYFRPVETFKTRFEGYIRDVDALGYTAIDLWLAILSPSWATEAHFQAAREVLAQYHMPVVSLAGWFGGTREEFDASCRLAKAVGATILGGMTGLLQSDRAYLAEKLRAEGLRFGYENHPEKNPAEVLAKIGDTDTDVIGTAVDTGWYGTNDYDAAQAIQMLSGRLIHVHLKDVRAAGAHDTCRFGEGVVPIERCVQVLRQIDYDGPLSVEHEPEQFDPSEDMKANLQLLKGWLA
jgi:L-ribulose-5-phosphate 3-epimerase